MWEEPKIFFYQLFQPQSSFASHPLFNSLNQIAINSFMQKKSSQQLKTISLTLIFELFLFGYTQRNSLVLPLAKNFLHAKSISWQKGRFFVTSLKTIVERQKRASEQIIPQKSSSTWFYFLQLHSSISFFSTWLFI